MNVIKLYDDINVGQTEYSLKGMVQSYNKHFVLVQFSFKENGPILMIFVQVFKEFSNLAALKKVV